MLSEKDIQQITAKGMSPEDVKEQLMHFKKGFPLLPIVEAVRPDTGLQQLSESTGKQFIETYETHKEQYSITKFTPASGAATRMFQHLYETLDSGTLSEKSQDFFSHLNQFAFYPTLSKVLQENGHKAEELLHKKNYQTLLTYLLTDKGMNLGATPKALIEFHRYGHETRTAIEEHLVEAAHYAVVNGKSQLHFTVSPEHRNRFISIIKKLKPQYEKKFNIRYEISFSEQSPNTDIVAAKPDKSPFRDASGKLLFRPGGHGALLQNLNALESDLIILKNIDNIIVDEFKETTYTYKKILTGIAIKTAQQTARYLQALDESIAHSELLDEIISFVSTFTRLPGSFSEQTNEEKTSQLRNLLDRPIRVCGMVPSDEDTGGGPFWVKQSGNIEDMQIVETAQLNMKDPATLEKTKKATHFNPVDIVCYTKNYQGKPFDLMQYRDSRTGFITKKSKDGKDLLAQELPGLWNGSMAHWISLFVEVPAITFNPVKSVNDLLLPAHQGI